MDIFHFEMLTEYAKMFQNITNLNCLLKTIFHQELLSFEQLKINLLNGFSKNLPVHN